MVITQLGTWFKILKMRDRDSGSGTSFNLAWSKVEWGGAATL